MSKKLSQEKILNGLKIIFHHLKPYKKAIFVLSFLSIFSALSNAVIPYLSGKIIDGILMPSKILVYADYSIHSAIYFLVIWFLIRLVEILFEWQIESKRTHLDFTVESDYIVNGYSHLLELPLSFHKKHKIGEIISKIRRGGDNLSSFVSRVLIGLSPQILSIIISLVIMFLIKALLAFILIMAVLIYAGFFFYIIPQLSQLLRKGHKAYSNADGEAYDSLLNTQSVKQAAAEEYEKRNFFKNYSLKYVQSFLKYMAIWNRASFSQRLIVAMVQAIIFIISIFMIQKNMLTVGELVMFNGYAAMLFGPFVTLAANWGVVHNGLISIERAEEILKEKKEDYEPQSAVILDKIIGEVEFKNVSFSYGRKQASILENLSFKIKPGEIVALVGGSGVGKSTLIDLISLYFKPNNGKVFIDGRNIKNLSLKFLRSQIAVVPQEILLFNDTVKNNIKYGSFLASDKKIVLSAQKAFAHEFIEKFPKKYNQMVGERGIKLSAGQKQRIAIARAVLRDPKILILDEPTSALDAQSEKYVTDALEELMKGRTTFIIAHRLATVRKADRIFVLDSGKIAEEGKHDDLIKIENGIYKNLYELQKL